jgi:hypothetical protein
VRESQLTREYKGECVPEWLRQFVLLQCGATPPGVVNIRILDHLLVAGRETVSFAVMDSLEPRGSTVGYGRTT